MIIIVRLEMGEAQVEVLRSYLNEMEVVLLAEIKFAATEDSTQKKPETTVT